MKGSLPGFMVPPSHKRLAMDKDPFFSFPSGFKFYLLRNLGNTYRRGFGGGNVVHGNVDENNLAGAVIGVIEALTTFGFQSSHPKLKDLLSNLVQLLDGRREVETRQSSQVRRGGVLSRGVESS